MMKPKPLSSRWLIVKILWIMACMYVLGHSLAYRNADAQEFEFFMMLSLSYPAGFLGIWGYGAMLQWIPSEGVAGIVLMWGFFFAIGSFQWLAVVPFVARKLRRVLSKPDLVSVIPKE